MGYSKIATLLAMAMLGSQVALAEEPVKEMTGKVMAVFYEPVKINNAWADKVSVTIAPCSMPGQLATYWYSPGSLSDDNALGFLFRDITQAARGTTMHTQYMNMVTGHVTLAVNDQNRISKTTFWGYNWECGRNISAPSSGSASAGAAPATGSYTPPPTQSPANTPANAAGQVLKNLGRFGF